MVRLLLFLIPLAIAFWIYSVVDCAMQPPTRHRGASKPAWMLIVLLLPVVGGVLWFVVGRGNANTVATVRAPDDDPAFLSGIGSKADQDERIRRLEEELAQLDAEGDDPRSGSSPGGPASGGSAGSAGGTADGATPHPGPGEKRNGEPDADGRRGAVG